MTDWNFDDENIDPSMGDEYGYWTDRSDLDWLNEEPDDDFLENETPDDEGYEDSSGLTKGDSSTQANYVSERMQSRLQIHALWDDSQFESARDYIVDYLREMSASALSRPYYLRLILASFFSMSTLDSEGIRKSWNLFESFMKGTNLNVSRNEVIETRSKLNGLVVGFYADALDSDIQLAAILRKDFRRADLALVILKRHMINGVLNTPYFNNTLLATLVDLKMLDEAKPISENLMKFSPMVPGSIERVLATQCRYLLEVFVSTGDLDYLDEAGKIIDRMPGSGVEQSYYLKCLARYLSLRGEKDKSAQAYEESEQVGQVIERELAPSTAKAMQNGYTGHNLDDLEATSVDPKRLESDVKGLGDDIIKVLRSIGFINPIVEQDPRANRSDWFFHTAISTDCSSGLHSNLIVLRSHYEGKRVDEVQAFHYFAIFCQECNLVSFLDFENRKYREKVRGLSEKNIPIKQLCPTCTSESKA